MIEFAFEYGIMITSGATGLLIGSVGFYLLDLFAVSTVRFLGILCPRGTTAKLHAEKNKYLGY